MDYIQNVLYGVVTEIRADKAIITAHNKYYEVSLDEKTKGALLAAMETEGVIVTFDAARQVLVDIDIPELTNDQLIGI